MTRSVRLAVSIGMLAWCAGTARAQQDPSGTWRTWTSAHFRVHARQDLAPFAVRLVREAERAYALLARELRPPRGRIDVALYDNVDFSNGFTHVFPGNRIILYLAAPATDISLGVYDDWLRMVTVHELTHVFHLDRADGIWRVLRYVFGRNAALFPNTYQPSWVTEGLATYYESRLTTAGRLRGGFHAQLLAARAPGRWPGPSDVTFGSPLWPSGFGPYAWGSRFFELVATLYGDTVIPGFVDRASRQVWPLALSAPLRGAGGAGVGETWSRLRGRWRGSGNHTAARVVASGLRSPPRLALSPDRQRVAYVERSGRRVARVVVYDLLDRRVVADHHVNGAVDLAWRGDTVYVTQLEFTSPVEIHSDLYRWLPGRSWERLSIGARLETPSVIGDDLVLVASGPATRTLVRLREDGSYDTLPAPPADDWGRVARSPDGQWIAGARHWRGRWDIVLWRPDRPNQVDPVTRDGARDEDPTWSADGRLVFASERDGVPQIYAYALAEGRAFRLTQVPTGAREPLIAADGTLLYATMGADGYAVVAQAPLRAEPVTDGDDRAEPVVVAAPPVPVVEGGYHPWPALVPRYWVPVSHNEGTAGRFFGAQTGSSDPAGRVAYGLTVTYAPSKQRAEGVFAMRYSRWRSWTVDASVGQSWERGGLAETTAGDTVPLALRERTLSGGLSWRWRRWRSSVQVRLGGDLEHDRFLNDGPSPLGFTIRDPTVFALVASASAVAARRPPLAISLEDGVAASVLYRRRWALDGPETGNEWRGTLSGYLALPLPGFAHWVVAARVRGALSAGTVLSTFALGGASSERFEIIPGVDLGGTRRTFALRGYPVSRERFTRITTEVVELRVPLIPVGRGIWWLPVGLDRVSGSLFGEAGGGWRAGETGRPFRYRDVGAELVLDLVVGYDTPLRARVGTAVPLVDGLGATAGTARGYLSIGASF